MRVRIAALATSAASWLLLIVRPLAASHSHHDEVGPLAVDWALMLVAMMAPPLIPAIVYVCQRSFARKRGQSVALFVSGYVVMWMLAGGFEWFAWRALASPDRDWRVDTAVLFVLGILWQCSPIKQRCLNRCHAAPALSAFGRAADADAFGFGVTHGLWCVGSCWALMLLPAILPAGHVAAMVGAAVVITGERFERPAPPVWRLRGLPRVTRFIVAHVAYGGSGLSW